MWQRQVILAVIGLSSGMIVAGGLFSFIISLGVISDIADRTHTGGKINLYENMVALGGILGNIVYVYKLPIQNAKLLIGPIGLFVGIFVGCWSMALAEVLNVFPICIRRIKLQRGVPYIILSIAIGKAIGALLFFVEGW